METMTARITGSDPYVKSDERDLEILRDRVSQLEEREGPRVGDFVRFSDDAVRRISHVWDWEDGSELLIQTSDGGSYYLGNGYVSMSGSLFPGIPASTLTLTDETAEGSVWFFHHDYATASNGVTAAVPFRVFTCSMAANR